MIMEGKITFNELRKIKDSLPDGSIRKIANEFEITEETVRNYFGGANYTNGTAVGIHMEPGPNGGIVLLDDTAILDRAKEILKEERSEIH
jgi:predicted transcriptional regulator